MRKMFPGNGEITPYRPWSDGRRDAALRRNGNIPRKWTPEDNATLLALHAEGLTRRQIAARMGVTHNSIIGKLYRLVTVPAEAAQPDGKIGIGSRVTWTAGGRAKLNVRRWDKAGVVTFIWDWPDSARTMRIRWDNRRAENAWEYDVEPVPAAS